MMYGLFGYLTEVHLRIQNHCPLVQHPEDNSKSLNP